MLTYDLDQRGARSLYEHLYRCIRADIQTGALAAHDRLPSKRTLAKNLGVSLITVEGAYAQLQAEGYLYTKERRGYFVMPLPTRSVPANTTEAPNGAPRNYAPISAAETAAPARPRFDFAHAATTSDPQTQRLWARALRTTLSSEPDTQHLQPLPAAGSPRLRNAIAAHLRAFRGMEVDPRCLIIGSGAQTLYNVIVQLLGTEGGYAVEDPGYPKLTRIYQATGAPTYPIPLDDQGLSISALREYPARVAHVMPSHQFPTGRVTSIARRYELLGWAAAAPNRYLIEDDYDCEFRLAGKPIPSLQSIDACNTVIYTNTFTKSLGADMRVAYLILPPPLMERFNTQLGFYSNTVNAVIQNALAHMIESGDYERHLNRIRTQHRLTRDALLSALDICPYSALLHPSQQDNGLHFVLEMDIEANQQEIAQAATKQDVGLAPLSSYRLLPAKPDETDRPAFVMHYSTLAPDQADEAVTALCTALKPFV